MFIGYKIISCKKELLSLLNKLDEANYTWRNQDPLYDAYEISSLENSYKYGDVALVFSDSKKIGYCSAKYAKQLFSKKEDE